jgi:tRNA threonylcarbamoyladenosine biosynthesis protein TsaE
MNDSLLSRSPEETERLGAALAAALQLGDVLALEGPLGAGKTRFVAGLARGLDCTARVRSPSFAIVHEYRGRLLLVHLDLYRLEPGDLEGLGLDEYLERGALAVEWAEPLGGRWSAGALRLRFTIVAENERRIVAEATAGRGLALLEAWRGSIAAAAAAPRAEEGS